MIDRRTMMKSALTLVGAPTLPAVASGFARLGTTSVHTEAEFRKALAEYLDAYRVWRDTPHSWKLPEFRAARESFWDARCRLREMVLANHGITYDPEQHTIGLASRSVDLGDVLIIVAVEAEADDIDEQSANVVLVPRSPEMFELLDSQPKQNAEEDYPEDDDEDEQPEPDPRPSVSDISAAITEAWAADDCVQEADEDETLEGAIKRQEESWDRVRELTRCYAGVPGDFKGDVAVVVGDVVVTIAEHENYEAPPSVITAGCDVWKIKRA
jgi:hypothetical protein